MLTFNKLVAGPEINKSLLGLQILNTVHSSASVYVCLEIRQSCSDHIREKTWSTNVS